MVVVRATLLLVIGVSNVVMSTCPFILPPPSPPTGWCGVVCLIYAVWCCIIVRSRGICLAEPQKGDTLHSSCGAKEKQCDHIKNIDGLDVNSPQHPAWHPKLSVFALDSPQHHLTLLMSVCSHSQMMLCLWHHLCDTMTYYQYCHPLEMAMLVL